MSELYTTCGALCPHKAVLLQDALVPTAKAAVRIVNGVSGLDPSSLRKKEYRRATQQNFKFMLKFKSNETHRA